jgi:Ca2+-binding RTX toxin-like protein
MTSMMKTSYYARKLALVLAAMLAALVVASGAALAVSKVCPAGSTQANPCSGTSGNDLLIGDQFGPDYIKGLAGNDKISGVKGDDTTDGGGGSDTYSYKNGWGSDTLIDSGGSADHLNFSAVAGAGSYGVIAYLYPESGTNEVYVPNSAERITPSGSSTVVEKVSGSSAYDSITTGQAANTLKPGPGAGGATLRDYGGCTTSSVGGCPVPLPASSDTYTGLAASGYGHVAIEDHGGTADKLVLPFASTDAYFEAQNGDSDTAFDNLIIETSSTDYVYIPGQLEPLRSQKGHIEQIQFTDETISIGGETPQAQTLGTARSAGGAEAQIAALNEASSLDAAEKERFSKAANKAIEEAKNNDNLLSGSGRGR